MFLDDVILILNNHNINVGRVDEESNLELINKLHRNIGILMNNPTNLSTDDIYTLYVFILLYNDTNGINIPSIYLDYDTFRNFRNQLN